MALRLAMICVFPASAGMILLGEHLLGVFEGVPRIRGDDPYSKALPRHQDQCSPHPRG